MEIPLFHALVQEDPDRTTDEGGGVELAVDRTGSSPSRLMPLTLRAPALTWTTRPRHARGAAER